MSRSSWQRGTTNAMRGSTMSNCYCRGVFTTCLVDSAMTCSIAKLSCSRGGPVLLVRLLAGSWSTASADVGCCSGAGCWNGEGLSHPVPAEAGTSCEGCEGAAAHGFVPAAAISRVLPKVPGNPVLCPKESTGAASLSVATAATYSIFVATMHFVAWC